jgi:hypothetical protein
LRTAGLKIATILKKERAEWRVSAFHNWHLDTDRRTRSQIMTNERMERPRSSSDS